MSFRLVVPLIFILAYSEYWVIPTIAAIVTIRRRIFAPNSSPDLPTYRQELEAVGNRWESFYLAHRGLITVICTAAIVVVGFHIAHKMDTATSARLHKAP